MPEKLSEGKKIMHPDLICVSGLWALKSSRDDTNEITWTYFINFSGYSCDIIPVKSVRSTDYSF